jgi:polysaccharide pyruvyl transferase WcaK-like protein
MCCREKQSLKELKKAIGKKVDLIISPDMANMMPYIRSETVVERCIGVSVSYQIIKQWSSNESYIDCMVNSINHILRNTDCKVLLIPNETSSSLVYHDQHVAEEIFNHIDVCGRVFVLDISNMNSTRLKSAIGKCEILIASRYHSCVAGLSSGVPTLVIGWHYKYLELLEKYHQSQWIISSDSCTSWEIIHKFDILWKCRESEKQKILNRYNYVCHQIIDASKAIFTV